MFNLKKFITVKDTLPLTPSKYNKRYNAKLWSVAMSRFGHFKTVNSEQFYNTGKAGILHKYHTTMRCKK